MTTKQEWNSGLHYIKDIRLEIYYEKMPMNWYIIKTFTFDIKYTYLLLSVVVLQSKSEADRFYDGKVSVNSTLGCTGVLLFLCLVEKSKIRERMIYLLFHN